MADHDLATQSSQVLDTNPREVAATEREPVDIDVSEIGRMLADVVNEHISTKLVSLSQQVTSAKHQMDVIEGYNRTKLESIEEKLTLILETLQNQPPANNTNVNPRKRPAPEDTDAQSAPPAKRQKTSKQARSLVGLVTSPSFKKYFFPHLSDVELTNEKKIAMYFEPEQGFYKDHPVAKKDIKLVFHLIYTAASQTLMINNIGWKDANGGTEAKPKWLFCALNDSLDDYDKKVVQDEINMVNSYLEPYHVRMSAEYQQIVDEHTKTGAEYPKTVYAHIELFASCLKSLKCDENEEMDERMTKILHGLRNVTYPSIYSVIVHSSLPTKTQDVNPLFLLFQPSPAIGSNNLHFRKAFTLHTAPGTKSITIQPYWPAQLASTTLAQVPLRLPHHPSMYAVEEIVYTCDKLASTRLSDKGKAEVAKKIAKLISDIGVEPERPRKSPPTTIPVPRPLATKGSSKSNEKRSKDKKKEKKRQVSSGSSDSDSEDSE